MANTTSFTRAILRALALVGGVRVAFDVSLLVKDAVRQSVPFVSWMPLLGVTLSLLGLIIMVGLYLKNRKWPIAILVAVEFLAGLLITLGVLMI